MTSSDEVSFLPENYQGRKCRRRIAMLIGTLLSLGILALGLDLCAAERALHQAQSRHSEVRREFEIARSQAAQAILFHEEQLRLVQQAQSTALLVDHAPCSHLLAELTNSLPIGTSLLSVSLESSSPEAGLPIVDPPTTAFDMKKAALEARRRAEVTPAEISRPDVSLEITGLAAGDDTLGKYVERLKRSPFFRNVRTTVNEIDSSRANPDGNVRRFEIQIMLAVYPERLSAKASRLASLPLGQ